MKVVINRCWGGFGLSDKAYERLIELGIPARQYIKQKRGPDGRYQPEPLNDGEIIFDSHINPDGDGYAPSFGRYWETWLSRDRSNPLLVQVVEELGEEASSKLSSLKVVQIPDGIDWEIDDYDGMESVREKHRSWS